MRKFIFSLGLLVPALILAQYGSNTEYTKFTKSEKKFNSWSISAYGGTAFMFRSDLNSINTDLGNWSSNYDDIQLGHDFQLGVTKQITHSFGVQLLGAIGRTEQNSRDAKQIFARTEYKSLSLLGDLNLSSLFRRVDNKSTYRWALHTYAGIGILDYDTKLNQAGHDFNGTQGNGYLYEAGNAWTKHPFADIFAQVGAGLRFKMNKRWDAEAKAMYVYTGDEGFDGGGSQYSKINAINKKSSDDMLTLSLGLHYKLGKQKENLQWFDPLHELYPAQQPQENLGSNCAEDKDQDGVCDNLDKQLDTPLGARVDGAGVAMDTDYDGLIDPLDKCPTVPGPVENKGCPIEKPSTSTTTSAKNNDLPAIEFLLNSDKLTSESSPILDNAATLIKQFFPSDKIVVEGHTDAYGTDTYNMNLSQRRVETVVKYLGSKGVNTSNLVAQGKGSSELKLTKCNPAKKCTDAENKQNRRVVFKLK